MNIDITMAPTIPIILFAYARPDHLRKTLESLRANHVPVIYIFSDGPKTPEKEPAIKEVRKIIHEIDWCTTIITERETNLGLGKSILTGVTEILKNEEMAIVFEDDLICVPGTYAYLCAALEQYRDDIRVMSVTGWTHLLVKSKNITDQPYFNGRAEC
jgi:GT2 family glycosyltransferase